MYKTLICCAVLGFSLASMFYGERFLRDASHNMRCNRDDSGNWRCRSTWARDNIESRSSADDTAGSAD